MNDIESNLDSTAVTQKIILFVDSDVTDYEALHARLGSDAEVHFLNAEEDGVLQMASVFYEELINAN